MINKKTISGILVAFPLAISTQAIGQQKLDMALAYPASNYHSELAEEFAKKINDAQNEVVVVTHPGGSLYGGTQIFSSTRRGLVPLGERFMPALSNENPIFGVDAIPFLATTFEESKELYEASKSKLDSTLENNNLKRLYSVPWPTHGLYVNKKIDSIQDMEGVKFRAFDPTTEKIAELMGAIPTSIEAADLSQAFATGVVDSMFGSGSTAYDTKLWEHVDYWYDLGAWLPKNIVFVNVDSWNSLSDGTQELILTAANDIEQQGWEKAREIDEWYRSQLTENGMKIMQANEQLDSEFKEIGEVMLQSWLEKTGDYGNDLIESYKQK